jgi:hypothetical protein
MRLEFARHIFEKSPTSNLMKIRPVTADLFHAERRTWQSSQSRQHLQPTNQPTTVFSEAPLFDICIIHTARRLKQGRYWLVKFIQPINYSTRQLKRSVHHCCVNRHFKEQRIQYNGIPNVANINILYPLKTELHLKTQSVPRSKHTPSQL